MTPTVRSGSSVKRLVALAGVLLSASACGYTMGNELHERGIRRIAVRVVGNETFRERLEIPITRAVLEELSTRGGFLPSTPRDADAILHIVLEVDRGRALVTGSRALPVVEGALEIAAGMRLTERGSGRVLMERPVLDRVEYRSSIQESLSSVQPELARDLARKIVLALESGF